MSQRSLGGVLAALVLLGVLLCAGPAMATPELETLDDAVEHIKDMYSSGNYTRLEVARELSSIVDQRVRNANSVERMQDSRNWKPWMYGTDYDPEVQLDRARGRRNHFDYDKSAQWVWKSRFGACEECACLSYYILKQAGVDENVRIVSSSAGSSGHNFVVWGMKDGAKTNDPSTWGGTAYVVDGWQGQAYTNKQAAKNKYIGRDGKATLGDRTKAHDKEAVVWKEDSSSSSGEFSLDSFCFVATAVYGTPEGPKLDTLRDFRDEVLMECAPGRAFVAWYYDHGPAIAEFVRGDERLRTGVRVMAIDPIVSTLRLTAPMWRQPRPPAEDSSDAATTPPRSPEATVGP